MSRLSWRRVAMLTVLVAVTGIGVVGAVAGRTSGQPEPVPWSRPAEVDGATLRLDYVGSECRDDVVVDVDEDATRVVVTVREIVRARSCSDVGIPYDVEVRLDAPLAGRELVDGTCEMAEYAHYLECRSDRPTAYSSHHGLE